jgi:hypothetical protein
VIRELQQRSLRVRFDVDAALALLRGSCVWTGSGGACAGMDSKYCRASAIALLGSTSPTRTSVQLFGA